MGFIVWFFGGLALLVILDRLIRLVYKKKYNDRLFGKVLMTTIGILLIASILTKF